MRELRVTSCWLGKTVKEMERRRFVKLKRCVWEPAAKGFRWYLKFSGSKRCRLKKSIRHRFAFTLKIQQMTCAMNKTSIYLQVSRISCCKSPAGLVVEFEKKSALTNKEFSSWTFSKANPAADDLATQFQQQRKTQQQCNFSSWRLATQTSSSPQKILNAKKDSLYIKLHHGNSKRFHIQQLAFSDADFIFSTKNSQRKERFFVHKASPWKFEKVPHAYKADFAQ
ncbi:hypothetical protein F511_22543 [Dorcoceras hygrometricum]|uniref:Uncharacterized protein n=1 Tax=Dorcoceras hygrometricum TaxID=472368 RepID=A0A2Z7BUU7_9LAMI|nr:hypothetical protein F511_22543 [Dorcoceras hygrometricum]